MMYEYNTKEIIIDLMGKTVGKIRKIADSRLKACNLTFTQFGTLFTLLQQNGMSMSQKELAKVIETDTTTIMVVCDSLEKKKLLKRVPDPHDRRINRLEVTAEGRNSIEKGLPLIQNMFDPLLSSFTEAESDMMLECMQKINQAIYKMERELKRNSESEF